MIRFQRFTRNEVLELKTFIYENISGYLRVSGEDAREGGGGPGGGQYSTVVPRAVFGLLNAARPRWRTWRRWM